VVALHSATGLVLGRRVIIYYMLTKHIAYSDLGGQYFVDREREHVQRRLLHRLERLGYAVTL
jgi:transposase